MFNKLNYFNKLICFMLIMVSIVVADNAYLYILFIIIAFLIGVLSNNLNISFLSTLSLLIYFYVIQHINYIWIFKLFLIFIFLFILKKSFTKAESRVFWEQLFYSNNNRKKLIKKIYYRDKYRENTKSKKFNIRKQNTKKTLEDMNDIDSISKLKYYGYYKKRTKYNIGYWNKIDSTVFFCFVGLFIISIICR